MTRSKRSRVSKTSRDLPPTPTIDQVGTVLAIHFHTIELAVDRDRWTTRWANEAATEFGIPKTTEDFAAALKAALATGVFYGIDECRRCLPEV